MKKIGIYIIRNIINKKVYIGQSVNMIDRFTGHLHYLRKNKHWNNGLQSLYNKYGEEVFNFSILEECAKDKLDNKEKWYIEYYNSYKNGYNNTEGGKPSIAEDIHNNKDKVCKICGKPVETKWHRYCDKHKFVCETCGKRNNYKKWVCKECEKKKKIEYFTCERCGKEFEKTGNYQKYCKECATEIRNEKNRERMRKKYAKKKNKELVC